MTVKTLENPAFEQDLARFRGEIDTLDDRIIALLKERSAVVQKIGALKHAHAPGRAPLRPGREALQLRRVIKEFEGSLFLPAAAAAVWRMMIMASLAVEGEIRVSVCAGESQRDLPWVAREYFGPFSPYLYQNAPRRVLGDIFDGKAEVGVLPALAPADAQSRWWPEIAAADAPKIFAVLPFVREGKQPFAAVAVGRIAPEETGDDISWLLIEADDTVSQDRLQSAFIAAGLEARWIEITSPTPGKRHHLVELTGFITPQHERYQKFAAALDRSLTRTSFLGAAAAPVVV